MFVYDLNGSGFESSCSHFDYQLVNFEKRQFETYIADTFLLNEIDQWFRQLDLVTKTLLRSVLCCKLYIVLLLNLLGLNVHFVPYGKVVISGNEQRTRMYI